MRTPPLIVALALVTVLGLAACGDEDSVRLAAAEDEVATGVGVDAETITLGVLTDRSGVVRDLGITVVQGHELWREEVNAAGGVCGRQIRLEVRDHGYKAELAKTQYPEVAPKSLGFLHLLGSPMLSVVEGDIVEDEITTGTVSFSSEVIDNPYLLMANTTYDLEMINGLSYLLREGEIAEGDTLGLVYIEGEYGGNALKGAEFFAARHDLDLKTAKVTAIDTDLTNVVTGFRGAGVDAIALATVAPQTASVAAANSALGLDVPLIATGPAFVPALLDTPAARPLTERLSIFTGGVPFSSDVPKAREIAERYAAAYPDDLPNYGVPFGYALGRIWGQILERACANKDLTRQGIRTAVEQGTAVVTDGLLPELDFSVPGAPPSREVYRMVPDETQPGGLRQVEDLFSSEDAAAYRAPHESGATTSP